MSTDISKSFYKKILFLVTFTLTIFKKEGRENMGFPAKTIVDNFFT
jgi:hypothetical protein